METSNGTTNGSDYNQHTESEDQSMDQSNNGQGGRKPGERIYASKEQDDDLKIFVGGLAWDTSDASLKSYFSQFGNVEDIDIKKDPVTKRPRGFAFVLFSSKDSVQKVLDVSEHKIDGKTVDPKLAQAQKKPERKKKLFVGGINADLSDDEIKNYFGEFGTVTETEFPEDRNTKKRLGFAFVTFDTADEAQKVLGKNRFHHIGSKKVEVSEAVSREERQQQKMRGGMAGAWGTRGRGGYGPGYRGGYGGYGGYEDQGFYGQGHYGQGGGYQSGYGGPGGYGYGQGGGGFQGYEGYGQGGYGQGGYGGYGDYSGQGYGSAGYGSGYGYGSGGYGGGYEQTETGKAPVNRRGGVTQHHPYTR